MLENREESSCVLKDQVFKVNKRTPEVRELRSTAIGEL